MVADAGMAPPRTHLGCDYTPPRSAFNPPLARTYAAYRYHGVTSTERTPCRALFLTVRQQRNYASFRIMAEFVEGIDVLSRVGPAVSIFDQGAA